MKYLVFIALFFVYCTARADDLIGGREARRNEFPELVYIKAGNGGRCSATVVSPKGERGVILTAGHCVEDGGIIRPVSGEQFLGVCRQSPQYKASKMGTDVALCLVDRPFKVRPASVAKRNPKVGETIVLTGYGCTSREGGGNDKILRVGTSKVTQDASHDSWFYTEGKTAICFGDSGGPAYLQGKGCKPMHEIAGVNSRGDIATLSMLTALNNDDAKRFLEAWAKENAVNICGVNKRC